MKRFSISILIILFSFFCGGMAVPAEELFPDFEGKKKFAREMSTLIERAWKKWQDSVSINDIYVDGSQGILSAGDIKVRLPPSNQANSAI